MHNPQERRSTNTSLSGQLSSPYQQNHNFTQRFGILDSFLPIVNGTKIPKNNKKCLFETDSDIFQNYKDDNSLISFLKMSYLSRNHTDLEKENAHFHISEAIISTIEHIKWNNQMPIESSTTLGIDCLTIQNGNLASLNSNEKTTSNASNDIAIVEQKNTNGDSNNDLNIEECVLPASTDIDTCAEIVGLTLISKFSKSHLPNLSELAWVMSDDVKPSLLKSERIHSNVDTIKKYSNNDNMPHSTSQEHNTSHTTTTRGTLHWAPPRRQIIFTIHPNPILKELLEKQKFLCAGCGMKITSQHKQNFRYCTYFGKYHCIGCHHNQVFPTPAYILQKWDFNYYPVSVFAYRLLEEIYTYPLFYVPILNPTLYIRSNLLCSARHKRQQLNYIKNFIERCRYATLEASNFNTIPKHITDDIDVWSMSDIFDARSKYLHKTIDRLIATCEKHITNCVLCKARGFLCEICHKDTTIYPWMPNVMRCQSCGSCFHEKCWKSVKNQNNDFCSHCSRIKGRC